MENTDYNVTEETTDVYEDPVAEYTVLSEGKSKQMKGLAAIGGAALTAGFGFLGYKAFGWFRKRKAERAELLAIKAELEAHVEEEDDETVETEV